LLDPAAAVLADGIRYLRGGSLDRAWHAFEQAAERAQNPCVKSEALRRLADVKRRRAQWDDALRLCAEALQIARDCDLPDEAGAARNIEGTIHLQQGDFDTAVRVFREALAERPSVHQRGLICQNLGTAYAQQGAHAEAAEWYARSSATFRAAGRRREEVLALVNQGNVRLDQGNFPAAEEAFRKALVQIDELATRDTELQALVEVNLAEALAEQGSHLDEAFAMLLNATGHFASTENRPYRVACHRVLALVSERQGNDDVAIGALERGLALAREIGSGPEIAYFQRELTRLQTSSSMPAGEPEGP
jgi:tetratricopeptide (TPR) repeat protein